MTLPRPVPLLACLLLATPALAQHTDEGCGTFTWDLSREMAAMRAPPKQAAASAELPKSAKPLTLGRHYDAQLKPQSHVLFPVQPGRARKVENAMAGLLHFRSGKAGRYRIALNSRHWIDVLDGSRTIESAAHEGRSGCPLMHKVVEFELPADRDLVLQLSGADSAKVGLVITGPA